MSSSNPNAHIASSLSPDHSSKFPSSSSSSNPASSESYFRLFQSLPQSNPDLGAKHLPPPPATPLSLSSSNPSTSPTTTDAATPNTVRFNSFALPAYRSTHPASSDLPSSAATAATPSSLPHKPSITSVAEPNSRHLSTTPSSSITQPHHHQQQIQQQQHHLHHLHHHHNHHHHHQQLQQPQPLLPATSTTTSPGSFPGSAAKTAGGGGGGGSVGSGVPNLSLGQIHLLIATINDRNYETKRREIQRVSTALNQPPPRVS